jgi:AAA domain
MGRIASVAEMAELLGPAPIEIKAPAERRHPFKEYTYEELTNAPKKVYLCGDDDRPVLLTDSLWQTMGLLKSGKTFFCLELGFCIAFGLEFHGLPTKEGNVAYVIAEGGIGRNFERVLALCTKYESELRAKFGIPEGDYFAAAINSGKFNLIDSPVDLANPDPRKGLGVDVLLDQLAHKPYVAVFLDTWARMLWASGGHDSDQNTVGPAVQGCDRIRKALGCTVVMVAHIGVSKDAQGRAKGLSDPAGAIDGATHCSKVGDGPQARYAFRATYQRHAVDGFTITAQLRDSGPNVVLMSDNVTKLVKLNKRAAQALDVLRGLEQGVTPAEWQAAIEAGKVFIGKDGKPLKTDALRKAIKRATGSLLAADVIDIDNEMVTIRSGPGGEEMSFGTAEEDFADEDE